eukprot:747778-Hanusia_phi.AAC.1
MEEGCHPTPRTPGHGPPGPAGPPWPFQGFEVVTTGVRTSYTPAAPHPYLARRPSGLFPGPGGVTVGSDRTVTDRTTVLPLPVSI